MPSAESAKPWTPRWIFLGSHGLRAGWGIAIFVLLLGVAQIGAVFALQAFGFSSDDLRGKEASAIGSIRSLAIGVFTAAMATLGMTLVERRPLADFGLGLKGMAPRFGYGLLVGFGLLAAEVGALVLLGAMKLSPIQLHGSQVWTQAALWGLACLMIGWVEELVMRGYLLAALTRGLGRVWAIVITALLFSAAHFTNVGESVIGLSCVVLVGLLLAWSVFATGSLWWAIGFHAAWDFGESFVFGTANSGFHSQGSLMTGDPVGAAWLSGGATGPEGSVLCILTLVAAALILWRWPPSPPARPEHS